MTQMNGDDADPVTWRKEFAMFLPWKGLVQIAMDSVDVTSASYHRQYIR